MTMDRRKFITITGASLSAAILDACNSYGPKSADKVLKFAERKNAVVERALFRHTSMDETLASAKFAGNALPSYFVSKKVPVWDRDDYKLEVGGMVDNPMKFSLQNLVDMPRDAQRVNHYCVEGWTAKELWTGVKLSYIASLVRPHREARYVDFQSFDDGYHESWDIESAMHRQTLIAYALDGRMLGPAHGAPARVYSPVKLGYKNTKYLTRIMFMPQPNGGYWSDRGYEWYGGV